MRTLFEIIEAVKSNQPATEEELRYTIMAMDALSTFDTMALRRLHRTHEPFVSGSYEESFKRWKLALDKSPKDWMGWNNDFANPEYQVRRKRAVRLFEKLCAAHDKEKAT